MGLPSSLGIASNKLVAKIATDVGKAAASGIGPPNAITIVPSGEEAAFLAPLPVQTLWGVGPKTALTLGKMGIYTIGDLAQFPERDLLQKFGKIGYELSLRSRGIDDRPIVTEHEPKSVSREVTFARDIHDKHKLYKTLDKLCQDIGISLRHANRFSSTIKIKMRWSDFTTITRQATIATPTDQGDIIFNTALSLLDSNWQDGQALRLLGVGVSGMRPTVQQLDFWDNIPKNSDRKERHLQMAVDEIRERFGDQIIKLGSGPNMHKD